MPDKPDLSRRPRFDLAGQLTDRIEGLVELVRDHSVRPVLKIVRYLIAGSMALLIGIVAIVVLVIAVMRLFDYDVFRGRVWAADLLLGGMLIGAGVFLLAKSNMRGSNDASS